MNGTKILPITYELYMTRRTSSTSLFKCLPRESSTEDVKPFGDVFTWEVTRNMPVKLSMTVTETGIRARH